MNEYNENYNTNYQQGDMYGQQGNSFPQQDNTNAQSGGMYAYAAPKKKAGTVFFIIRLALCCLGIFIGGLLVFNTLTGDDIFFGLGISGSGDYAWQSVKFGADFYTEIYAITRNAAYNTYHTVSILNDGLNIICLVLGFCMVLGFGMKLVSVIEKRKKPSSQNN